MENKEFKSLKDYISENYSGYKFEYEPSIFGQLKRVKNKKNLSYINGGI